MQIGGVKFIFAGTKKLALQAMIYAIQMVNIGFPSFVGLLRVKRRSPSPGFLYGWMFLHTQHIAKNSERFISKECRVSQICDIGDI